MVVNVRTGACLALVGTLALSAACNGAIERSEPDAGSLAAREAGTRTEAATRPLVCLGHSLTWTRVGGWTDRYPSGSITKCRAYEHTVPRPQGPPAPTCASEIGVGIIEELVAVVEAPDVVAAFARGGSAGVLRAPSDGVDDVVTLDGVRLVIGARPGADLETLLKALHAIDARECPEDG